MVADVEGGAGWRTFDEIWLMKHQANIKGVDDNGGQRGTRRRGYVRRARPQP